MEEMDRLRGLLCGVVSPLRAHAGGRRGQLAAGAKEHFGGLIRVKNLKTKKSTALSLEASTASSTDDPPLPAPRPLSAERSCC